MKNMKTTYKLILKDGSVLMSKLTKKTAEQEKLEYEKQGVVVEIIKE